MSIDLEKRNEPTDEEIQGWVDEVYRYTFEQMVNNGVTTAEMKKDLIDQGLSGEYAETVVSNVKREIDRGKRERGKKDMIYGALWCVGGLTVTIATYSAASNGGTYVVAYGAIIWGAIQFFKGLTNIF